MTNKAIQTIYMPTPFSMTGSLEGMDKGPNFNQGHITPTKGNFKQTLRYILGGEEGECSTYGLYIHHQITDKNIMVRSQGDRQTDVCTRYHPYTVIKSTSKSMERK